MSDLAAAYLLRVYTDLHRAAAEKGKPFVEVATGNMPHFLEALRAACEPPRPRSTSAYMASPHYRVNKFVAAMRVMRPAITKVDGIGPFPLMMDDLEAVIRDTADYYRDTHTEARHG